MRNFVRRHFKTASASLVMVAVSLSNAADINRVNSGATVNIVAHGDNLNVTNSCGIDKMVPAKTVGEWNNFKSNKPACLSFAAPPPTTGVWVLSATESCADKYAGACSTSNNCGYPSPEGQSCTPLSSTCYKRTTVYEYMYNCN